MINISNSPNNQSHPSHLLGVWVLSSQNCFLLSVDNGILREPKKIGINGQVLGKLAIKIVVQSLCNGKTQGLSAVLTRLVYETGPSQPAALKLFWMQNYVETGNRGTLRSWLTHFCWCLVPLLWKHTSFQSQHTHLH